MQQFYGLDIDEFELAGDETTPPILRLAALTTQLPMESRVAKLEHPELQWQTSDYLLRQIEWQLRALMWSLAGGKGDKPKPLPTPDEIAEGKTSEEKAVEQRKAVDSLLGMR